MLNLERQDEILAILSKNRSATVGELAKALYVSEATIRRDLIVMDHLSMIRRTHGGAVLSRNTALESAFAVREMTRLTQKRMICGLAIELIRDNSTLILDSSSTVMAIIPLLQRFHHLTVATYGIRTALMLSNLKNVDVYIVGGRVENFSNSVLGVPANDFLATVNADFALLSCSGINSHGEITDDSLETAQLKRVIVQRADKILLLCDSSKFDRTMMNTALRLENADYLITEKKPSVEYANLIQKNGCQLICGERI